MSSRFSINRPTYVNYNIFQLQVLRYQYTVYAHTHNKVLNWVINQAGLKTLGYLLAKCQRILLCACRK